MSDNRMIMMEAVARRRKVTATYNGEQIELAPHQLFERHGDLFVSALNLSKNWRSEDERRLGQFKLAGLSGAAVMDEEFEPLPSYQPGEPREGDTIVLAI